MSKTVVGLFKSKAEAQNVKHELVDQGYVADDIRIVVDASPAGAAPDSSADRQPSETGTGLGATISNFFRSLTGGDEEAEHHYTEGVRQGGSMLSVLVADGHEDDVADLLEHYGAKGVDTEAAAASSAAGATGSRAAVEGGSIPVVEEDLQVGKRQVQRGGVRVYSHIVEQPVQETVQLREEHVRVDRHTVNRPATEAAFSAFKEGTIDLTETAEEAVVSKNARIVEEIVIGKETSERTQTIQDTVRHTEVEVEDLGTGKTESTSAFQNDESGFRTHFNTNYATGGNAYESYAPAYQYGHTLANDPRYASSNWSSVEAAAQQDWASKGTGKWEDFKGAVQEGWNKVRGSTGLTR